MRPKALYAKGLLTGLPVRLETSVDGRVSLQPCQEGRRTEWWVAPGLLDLQVNGFAGVDFQQSGLTSEQLLQSAMGLLRCGCTCFFPTVVSDDWDAMLEKLSQLKDLRAQHPLLRAMMAGWHLEGPFLSEERGYHGAHPPEKQVDPKPSHFRALRALLGPDPILVTLAPERKGSLQAIRTASQLGIGISLGHTNADARTIREATESGAVGFTHLGNACPQLLDRHQNILWNILDQDSLRISLIPDGLHVSPTLFRLIHRAYPGNCIQYVTDAMSAAGAPPGRYTLGKLVLDVGPDRIVRQPGETNFAGSSLTPIEGVRRAFRMLHGEGIASIGRVDNWGRRERELLASIWRRYSVVPGTWVRHQGGRGSGAVPSYCLFRLDPETVVRDLRVFADGKEWEDLA